MRRAILEKQRKVEELTEKLKGSRTVLIADIEGVPAKLMQKVRVNIKNLGELRVFKNVIIERSLKNMGGKYEELISYVEGHPTAVIITNEDPLKVFKEVNKFVEWAPLRPNKPSPVDVKVEPGPVPAPITALSELKASGLPVKSVKGKIEIEKEEVVVRKGEVVSEKLAKALELIGIRPVKVHIKIKVAYSDGLLFTEDVLSITPEHVLNDVITASRYAFNLSYNAGYPTKDTISLFIADAHRKAMNLAMNASIPEREVLPFILSSAYAKAVALASKLPKEALDEKTASLIESEAEEDKKEEKDEKKDEEKDEDNISAGLSALFG